MCVSQNQSSPIIKLMEALFKHFLLQFFVDVHSENNISVYVIIAMFVLIMIERYISFLFFIFPLLVQNIYVYISKVSSPNFIPKKKKKEKEKGLNIDNERRRQKTLKICHISAKKFMLQPSYYAQ